MKIYSVFIEKVENFTPIANLVPQLESLYTTKEGAENRVRKLEKLGMLNPYYISKPLRGNIKEFGERHATHVAKSKGSKHAIEIEYFDKS